VLDVATRLQWRYNLKDVNLSEATTEFEGTAPVAPWEQ